ncbi:MAG: hemin uptake protein HemP [Gemmataceae bacterium]
MAADEPDDELRESHDASVPARVLKAEDLFGRERELWIELDGIRYRLRITRRGKLILQK